MIILTILGLILLTIIILIIIIIIIPYHYEIKGENFEDTKFDFSVSCFLEKLKFTFAINKIKNNEMVIQFFNFSKSFDITDKEKGKNRKEKKKKDKKDKKDKKEKKKKEKKKEKSKTNWLKRFDKEIIDKIIIFVKRLFKEIFPRKFSLNAVVGFNDPMYTGILYALYSEAYYLLDKSDIVIKPIFDDEVLKYKFLISGRIWFFNILVIALRFIFSYPIRRQIFLMIKE